MVDIDKRDVDGLMRNIDLAPFGSVEDEIRASIETAYRWGYDAGYDDGFEAGKKEAPQG